MYARIDLSKTFYEKMDNCKFLDPVPIDLLQKIYKEYCSYKQFKSVMPIFESEFVDPKNEVIGYFDNNALVAFSLLRLFDNDNVEAVQFAWDYKNPKLRLGINSLQNECAVYKERGYKHLYLGGADEYKSKIDGFELLGPV
jgi:hypothetical protein